MLLTNSVWAINPAIISYLLSDSGRTPDYVSINYLNNMNVYTLPELPWTKTNGQVRSISTSYSVSVPNSDDSWDLLKVYYKEYWKNYQLISYDTGKNRLTKTSFEGTGQEILLLKDNNVLTTDKRLFFSNLKRPNLSVFVSVYDADADKITHNITLSRFVQGERAPLVIGTNGKIYGAAGYKNFDKNVNNEYLDPSRHATAFEIDPATSMVTEYGKLGPDHSSDGSVWGYSVAADDTHVYVVSGKIPWYLIAYNRSTGEQQTLFTTADTNGSISVKQYKHGVIAYVSGNINGSESDGSYWLKNGRATIAKTAQAERFDDCPWNPEGIDPFTSFNDIHFPDLPKIDDYAARGSEADQTLWYQLDTLWNHVDYSVDTHQIELKNGLKLDNGKILIAARAYSGYSLYDPKTNQSKYLGKIPLSGSLAMSQSGSKIYISGYPSSISFEYDPSKAWTQSNNKDYHPENGEQDFKDQSLNPRFLGYFNDKSGVHKPYKSAVDNKGKVYFVGRWYRNGIGGGLAWYDPKTDTHDGYYEYFSNYQLRHIAPVLGGQYMMLSGTAVKDSTLGKPTPVTGRLFLLDTNTNQIINTFDPLPESISAGDIIDVGNGFIMGLSSDSLSYSDETETYIYKMNALTGEIIFKHTLQVDTLFETLGNMNYGYGFKLAEDGNVYVLFERKGLVSISKNGDYELLGRLSGYGQTLFYGSDVYLLHGEDLEYYKDAIK